MINAHTSHSPELEIRFWKFNQYLPRDDGPGAFIPVEDAISQAARVTVSRYPRHVTLHDDQGDFPQEVVWATVGQTRSAITFGDVL